MSSAALGSGTGHDQAKLDTWDTDRPARHRTHARKFAELLDYWLTVYIFSLLWFRRLSPGVGDGRSVGQRVS